MQFLAISRPFFPQIFENICQKRIKLTRKDKDFQLSRGLGRFKTKNYFQRQLPVQYVGNLLDFSEDLD